jgi:hypothetical protein
MMPDSSERGGWRTIESAPKQVTLLLYAADSNFPEDSFFFGSFWSGEWLDNSSHLVMPTHWMPLPAPPEEPRKR